MKRIKNIFCVIGILYTIKAILNYFMEIKETNKTEQLPTWVEVPMYNN